MFLKKLTVYKTDPLETIREINFNLHGLNLIVDNTTNTSTDTGNSVGKSTVIKIKDLCLGAKSPKDLYSDKDTHS